jgi:hypothetical protein
MPLGVQSGLHTKTPPLCPAHASPEGHVFGHSAPSQVVVAVPEGQPPSPHWQVETQKFTHAQKSSALQAPASCWVEPVPLPLGVQTPSRQSCPPAHAWPQVPQLSRSPEVTTHWLLQSVDPVAQVASQAHVPDSHRGVQPGWAGQSQGMPRGAHPAGAVAPSSIRQGFWPSCERAITHPPQLQSSSLHSARTQSPSLAQLPGVGSTHCPLLPPVELPLLLVEPPEAVPVLAPWHPWPEPPEVVQTSPPAATALAGLRKQLVVSVVSAEPRARRRSIRKPSARSAPQRTPRIL